MHAWVGPSDADQLERTGLTGLPAIPDKKGLAYPLVVRGEPGGTYLAGYSGERTVYRSVDGLTWTPVVFG